MEQIKDAIIILVISVSIIGLAEIVLRIIYPDKIFKAPDVNLLAYEHDNNYIITLKPNIEKSFVRGIRNGGDTINWKTNSKGFRGNELKESYTKRVMVFGDSNIQARFSNLENTYPKQLEAGLSSQYGFVFDVINAGIVGAGPDQQLIRLLESIEEYQPDLIILHFYTSNDFGDVIRNRLFEFDEYDNLIRTDYPIEIDSHLQEPSLIEFVNNSFLLLRAIKKNLGYGYEAPDDDQIIERDIKISQQEFNIYKERKPRQYSHFDDHYDIDIAIDPKSESAQIKIELVSAIFREMKEITARYNTKIIFLIQPAKVDISSTSTRNSKLKNISSYKSDNLSKAAETACFESKVNCLNLFDVFYGSDPDSLYFTGKDNHWNDKGQKLAAEETISYIKENNLF